MGETTDNRPNNQEGQSFTAREFELMQELVRSRMEKNEELQYESFEGYELPPRTQFSMLKKPAVSIKYRQLTFNMAAIRLFEGVKHVLTVVNTEKKRLAVVPCAEEESASVEWARVNKQGKWDSINIGVGSVPWLSPARSALECGRHRPAGCTRCGHGDAQRHSQQFAARFLNSSAIAAIF